MCFWKFNGQALEYTVGVLSMEKTFSGLTGSSSHVYASNKENIGKFGLNLVCQESDLTPGEALKKKKVKEKEEVENIYVTFLCIGFLNDTLITTGDDGYIYIWEQARIIRRVFAHEGAIYALDCN